MFEEANEYRLQLPNFYIRTVDIANHTVSYKRVIPHQHKQHIVPFQFIGNYETSIDQQGNMWPRNFRNHMFDETINVVLLDERGLTIDNLNTRFRVVRNPIPVESISIGFWTGIVGEYGDRTFVNFSAVGFSATILPSNASFQDSEMWIENIVYDGIVIQGRTAELEHGKYAFIRNGLQTTLDIPIGAIITVQAKALFDDVYSNKLSIVVENRHHESFRVRLENWEFTVVQNSITNIVFDINPSSNGAMPDIYSLGISMLWTPEFPDSIITDPNTISNFATINGEFIDNTLIGYQASLQIKPIMLPNSNITVSAWAIFPNGIRLFSTFDIRIV